MRPPRHREEVRRIERRGDERMTKGVRADLPGDLGPPGHSSHDPTGRVPVEPQAVGPEEDRAVQPFTDREIDSSGGARGERDRDDLAALAQDDQGPMPSFEAEAVDVRPRRLRDPQPVQREQRDQRVLARSPETRGDEQRTDLVTVQTGGVGLVIDARTAYMHRRRVGQQAFLLGVTVEARHRAQPAGHSRPSPAATLKLPGELLDVSPARLEQVQVVVVAPGDVLAQVQFVRVSGQPAVAGEKPAESEPLGVSKDGVERDDRRRGRRGCQCGTSRVG